jgi:hypothetical protein
MAKATPLSLEELKDLMHRLQATLDILVGHGGGGKRVKMASSGGNGKRAGGPRRDRGAGKELQTKLHDTLKSAKDGLSLSELVDKVGGSKETIGYHLRVLRDGKQAKLTGTRNSARWHAA